MNLTCDECGADISAKLLEVRTEMARAGGIARATMTTKKERVAMAKKACRHISKATRAKRARAGWLKRRGQA